METSQSGRVPHRWRRWLAAVVILVIAAAVVLDVRWIAFPRSDRAAVGGLIVVLGPRSEGDRLGYARRLAAQTPGVTVLVSSSTYEAQRCPGGFAAGTVVKCFTASPFTTQGEARFTATYARAHGAPPVTVLTTTQQVSRARLRFSRCLTGTLRIVNVPRSTWALIEAIPYETGATLKAELLQRSC